MPRVASPWILAVHGLVWPSLSFVSAGPVRYLLVQKTGGLLYPKHRQWLHRNRYRQRILLPCDQVQLEGSYRKA